MSGVQQRRPNALVSACISISRGTALRILLPRDREIIGSHLKKGVTDKNGTPVNSEDYGREAQLLVYGKGHEVPFTRSRKWPLCGSWLPFSASGEGGKVSPLTDVNARSPSVHQSQPPAMQKRSQRKTRQGSNRRRMKSQWQVARHMRRR